jgi:hypothetical protein
MEQTRLETGPVGHWERQMERPLTDVRGSVQSARFLRSFREAGPRMRSGSGEVHVGAIEDS